MQEARKLHAYIITRGLQHEDLYLRKLITFFANKNPSAMNYAGLIFNHIEAPSAFICNVMIRAYASCSDPSESINVYNTMRKQGYPHDKFTFPFVFKACFSLMDFQKGKEIHCTAMKYGFVSDKFTGNSLIHLYGLAGDIDLAHQAFVEIYKRDVASWTSLLTCYCKLSSIENARRMFDEMPERNIVSYSSMISGYVRRNRFREALCLFRDMKSEKMEPNDSLLMGVICSCANLGSLDSGKWIHAYMLKVKKNGFDSKLNTALINMYFKCGCLENAESVFGKIEVKYVGEWTAMISGMALHGNGERAIELFNQMMKSGVKPNVVTFVALLSACAHAGLVEYGFKYFRQMKSIFGIEPSIEHWGCVIDLFARAGLIDLALSFIYEMPFRVNSTIWGALLCASRIHGNVEIGELAATFLVKEEPWNAGLYMALLNLYSDKGRWDDVERIKKKMKETCCRKNPGYSSIEVSGVCYEFIAGDKSHPSALELCSSLGELLMEVKQKNCSLALE